MKQFSKEEIYDLEKLILDLEEKEKTLTYENKVQKEQLILHSVVKSLPTIKERDIELSEMLANYYEDDERQFKKEFKFGFKHCFKWMHDKMSV